MTGFGRGIASSPERKITVEIKSLNSKQLDLFMRVPSCFRELEIDARTRIAPALERGKVEMTAAVEHTEPTSNATLNLPVIESYRAQVEEMAARLGIEPPADWYATLLRLPDTLQTKVEEIHPADRDAFFEAASLYPSDPGDGLTGVPLCSSSPLQQCQSLSRRARVT